MEILNDVVIVFETKFVIGHFKASQMKSLFEKFLCLLYHQKIF
jgi:hypothetical protein